MLNFDVYNCNIRFYVSGGAQGGFQKKTHINKEFAKED